MSEFFSKHLFFNGKHKFRLPYSRPRPLNGIEKLKPIDYRGLFGASRNELANYALQYQQNRCAGCGHIYRQNFIDFISWNVDEINHIVTPSNYHIICPPCSNFLNFSYGKVYSVALRSFKGRSDYLPYEIGSAYFWPDETLKVTKFYQSWVQNLHIYNQSKNLWEARPITTQLKAINKNANQKNTIETITVEQLIFYLNSQKENIFNEKITFRLAMSSDNFTPLEIEYNRLFQWLKSMSNDCAFMLTGETLENKYFITLSPR